jgi:2-phosphosulfolactate phosphatase
LEKKLKITVYFNPKDVKPTVIQNATVVLVDVLRATTIIPMFLYHGAEAVGFYSDPGSAKKAFEKLKRGEGLLAGERDWGKIPGFPMSGSPLDSNRDKIKGRIVCFSTQSPLKVFKNAKYVILGSFINLNDVYDSCLRGKRDVVIVCAGGPEDFAFAGMLVDFLQSTLGSTPIVLAESAKDAISLYKPWQGRLLDLLKESPDGKELIQKGYAKDLDFCVKVNRVSSVPFLKGDVFEKEDTPRPKKILDEAKAKAAGAAQKGKSIKVTVPLFPKNPEHPVPGMEKSGKKGAQGHDDKKHEDKKHGDKKHADKKHEKVLIEAPKKGDAKGTIVKPKKVVVHKPMFSKKTVATAIVKLIKKPK